jgi:hypothetical protein
MEKTHFWEAYSPSDDIVISTTVTAAGSLLPSWQKSATAPCLHAPTTQHCYIMAETGRHHSCVSLSSRLCLHLQFLACKSRNQKYDTITFITCCTFEHAHIPPFILFLHPHPSRLQIWRQDHAVLKIQFLRSVTPCRWVSNGRHFGDVSCLRNVEKCVLNDTA